MNTKNMREKINAFLADEKGAEVAEWAVVVAIIVAIAVVAYKGTLALTINNAVSKLSNAIG
jgi:Flp pilus assembly pilin Flp